MPLVASSHGLHHHREGAATTGEKSEDLPSHSQSDVVHAAFEPWRSEMMQGYLCVFINDLWPSAGSFCRLIHSMM
jgi:hypothetical protein